MTSGVWTNWVGNQSFQPAHIIKAHDEAQAIEVISSAASRRQGIRVPGTGHSFTPIVETDGILLDLADLNGIIGVNVHELNATAWSQTSINAFGEPLWAQGLALANQGVIDTQTIAGAISTATHGSGLRLRNFSATLRACRLVDGRGQVHELTTEADPDVFPALQTSIGLMGVMTRITIEVTTAYTLHERMIFMHVDEVRERWRDLLDGYRSVSFWWMPTDSSAQLYGFPATPRDICMVQLHNATHERPGARVLSEGERIDRSYRIFPHVFEPNYHELEYFMPAEHGLEIFEEQRRLMLAALPDSVFPMEVRFVAADDAWMSPSYGHASMVIGVSGKPGTNYWPYLRRCDELFQAYSGRPHWGKLHFMTAERLARLFPKFESFRGLRRQFDPEGIFLNAHLRELFE